MSGSVHGSVLARLNGGKVYQAGYAAKQKHQVHISVLSMRKYLHIHFAGHLQINIVSRPQVVVEFTGEQCKQAMLMATFYL